MIIPKFAKCNIIIQLLAVMSFHNVCWQVGTGEEASVRYSLIVQTSEIERNRNYFKETIQLPYFLPMYTLSHRL